MVLDILHLYQPVCQSVHRERRNTFDAEFVGDVFAVGYYGWQTHAQFIGNFLVDISLCEQLEHFDLTL